MYFFNIECFCPYRASILWQSVTQGVASLALGYVLLPFQGVHIPVALQRLCKVSAMKFTSIAEP